MDRPNQNSLESSYVWQSNVRHTFVHQSSESSKITSRTIVPPIVESEVKLLCNSANNNSDTSQSGLEHENQNIGDSGLSNYTRMLTNQGNSMLALNKSGYNGIALTGKNLTIDQCTNMMLDNSQDEKLEEIKNKLRKRKEFFVGLLQEHENRLKVLNNQYISLEIKYNAIRYENEQLDTMLKSSVDLNKLLTTRTNVLNELKEAKESRKKRLLLKERRRYLEKVNALLTNHVKQYELSIKEFNDLCSNENNLIGGSYENNEMEHEDDEDIVDMNSQKALMMIDLTGDSESE